MSRFIPDDFWCERKKIEIVEVIIDEIPFKIMALTESFYKQVQECEASIDALNLAANAGMMYNRERIIDDPELSKDFKLFWGQPELEFDTTPTLRHQVGRRVCDISGLKKIIDEKIELEDAIRAEEETEAEAINTAVDGDNLPDDHVTMGQLEDDANQANAA